MKALASVPGEVLIDLSDKVKLPARTAVVQRYAFVAASGAGKTYGAGVLVEQLHAAGAQFVVLDPVGVWYGLRFAEDGKAPGISVPVIGGLHGDSEISEESAELLADLVVERRASLVIDVSMMRKAARIRFATTFLEQLFQKKKGKITNEEVIAGHLAALGGPEGKILTVLLRSYPDAMDRSAVAAMAGYAAGGGSFNRYVSTLVSRGVVERVDGGELRASSALFELGDWKP